MKSFLYKDYILILLSRLKDMEKSTRLKDMEIRTECGEWGNLGTGSDLHEVIKTTKKRVVWVGLEAKNLKSTEEWGAFLFSLPEEEKRKCFSKIREELAFEEMVKLLGYLERDTIQKDYLPLLEEQVDTFDQGFHMILEFKWERLNPQFLKKVISLARNQIDLRAIYGRLPDNLLEDFADKYLSFGIKCVDDMNPLSECYRNNNEKLDLLYQLCFKEKNFLVLLADFRRIRMCSDDMRYRFLDKLYALAKSEEEFILLLEHTHLPFDKEEKSLKVVCSIITRAIQESTSLSNLDILQKKIENMIKSRYKTVSWFSERKTIVKEIENKRQKL